MSQLLKEHVTSLLELLEQSSLHLQSSIGDFIQQIKTRAMECVDNNSDTKMTMKDVLAMVTSAQSTIIEHTDMFTESTKLYPPTVMTGESLKPADTGFISQASRSVECCPETLRRLKDIETALSSLQDTKQKTEDDISEIKQWRDNFITEQSDMVVKVENLSRKQKQNLKNLRKQTNEQDKKIEDLNQEIESLKTKESDTNKTLEKLSLDMKEYENNLHTLNKEMRVYTDKTDNVTQEIKRHSDLISAIQEDTTKTFDTMLSKHVALCKLLQQRLMPIDKIIEIYNQNSETRERKINKIETLEKDVLKLSQDFHSAVKQQVKYPTLWFTASRGCWEGVLVSRFFNVITFKSVVRNKGKHFDPNTGEFTAPVDGLYRVSLTIRQTDDRIVEVAVRQKSGGVTSSRCDVRTTNISDEASRTIEVRMKSGDLLFLATGHFYCECTHFSCTLLGG